jgi:reverse gyrase
VQRITFTEVTSRAVRSALASPRTVSPELVDAYLARRALDYLFGFTLSPLLWRKLPGSRSAGAPAGVQPPQCHAHAAVFTQVELNVTCLMAAGLVCNREAAAVAAR